MSDRPIALTSIREEIVGLHEFFVLWFCAGPQTNLDFARCDDALAADFHMVTPDGSMVERPSLIAALRAARGSAKPGFSIAIEHLTPLWQDRGTILVTYVEAQIRDGRPTRRRSSALFSTQDSAPHGVAWRHLHETWMQATDTLQVHDLFQKRGDP